MSIIETPEIPLHDADSKHVCPVCEERNTDETVAVVPAQSVIVSQSCDFIITGGIVLPATQVLNVNDLLLSHPNPSSAAKGP